MSMSRRARRIQRRYARRSHGEHLTLVSMVDILTALVVFLLANSVAMHSPPIPGNLTLPKSTATQRSNNQFRVAITREQILVHNQPVISTSEVLASNKATIPALTAVLLAQQSAAPAESSQPDAQQPPKGRGEATIMADKGLPYSLIRKVMLTLTDAAFEKISLAVLQKSKQE